MNNAFCWVDGNGREVPKLSLGTYLTVVFCPSGEVQCRSVRWIINHHGLRQLQRIKRGEKFDVPIFHDSVMED